MLLMMEMTDIAMLAGDMNGGKSAKSSTYYFEYVCVLGEICYRRSRSLLMQMMMTMVLW